MFSFISENGKFMTEVFIAKKRSFLLSGNIQVFEGICIFKDMYIISPALITKEQAESAPLEFIDRTENAR